MDDADTAWRVRIYLSEGDSWQHQPTPMAVLELLLREGCAGASVFKGTAGFGAHGRIHATTLAEVVAPLPVVVEWVDMPQRVQRLLPALAAMVDGLITVEEVRVAKQPQRTLRDVPRRLLVREVMTPADRIDAASPETSLHELVNLLLHKRRNAIPVLDADRRVVGIVTNSDLVERAGLPLRLELLRALGSPDEPSVAAHLTDLHGEGRTAGSIMTPDVVTIGPAASLADAAALMLSRRLKRLPVVDDDGRLLGMLSRFDILKSVSGIQAEPAVPDGTPPQPQSRPPRRIGDAMNRDVPTIRPDAPLEEALAAVMATRLHRAVVIDAADRPVGIIVDTDLMQRITPAAHPGVVEALMHRVLPATPEQQEEWRRRTGQRVADVMRSREQMLIVPADASVADVIDQSLQRQIKLVAVTDEDGRLAGMVDRRDLLAALAA